MHAEDLNCALSVQNFILNVDGKVCGFFSI